ncbi:MAG: hypothetical protein HFJ38_04450 [Bacilli bacterium]|nr:hypothetical protein [Bacilli bacterium]
MKFYNVIYESIYLEKAENIVTVTPFLNKDLAMNYIKREIKEIKKQVAKDEIEDYCIEETEDSYERYLDGRSSEDSVSIYIKESDFYDEKELLQEKQEIEQEKEDEKENENTEKNKETEYDI